MMDFPHFREVELICDGRHNFDDYEGSFSLRCKLWVGDKAFQISGFQSDLVSLDKGGEASVVFFSSGERG